MTTTLPLPGSVAVFRALVLGDLLCATPALRAMRDSWPGARIALVGLPWARELVERLDSVDDFIEFAGWPGLPERPLADAADAPRFIARMRAERFDLAVQLHGSGGIVNPLVAQFGARHTAGFADAVAWRPAADSGLFAPWPEHGTEVERLLALTDHLGLPRRGTQLDFPLRDADRHEAARLLEPVDATSAMAPDAVPAAFAAAGRLVVGGRQPSSGQRDGLSAAGAPPHRVAEAGVPAACAAAGRPVVSARQPDSGRRDDLSAAGTPPRPVAEAGLPAAFAAAGRPVVGPRQPASGPRGGLSATGAPPRRVAEAGLPVAVGRRPFAIVHPGSQLPSRRWPPERFAAVADTLAADGFDVVITGTAGEAALTAGVAAAMRATALDLAGRTTLWSLGALVERAALVVCNDTGLSHVAAALGTPSVVVSSGGDARRWAPADAGRHTVLWHDVPCRPCAHAVCPIGHPCALAVGVDDVRRAVRLQLARPASAGAAATTNPETVHV